MARYHTVLSTMWDDPVFQAWSADAKLIFLNLITSPRHNPIGLYAVTTITLQFETQLPPPRFTAAFDEVQRPVAGYARVRYDTDKAVIWVVNTLKHQPAVTPKNTLLLKHVQALLAQYETCVFMPEVVRLCKAKGLLRGFKGTTKGTNTQYTIHNKDIVLTPKTNTKETLHSEQPHQTLINRFLDLKGTSRPTLTPAQVSGAYKRHSRSALALIAEAGGLDHALVALDCAAAYFERKALTWTLDTIAKHLPDVGRYTDELTRARHGFTANQLAQFRQLASWLARAPEPAPPGTVSGTDGAGISHVQPGP